MKKGFQWLINFLLYSNLFIAICAMAFVMEACLLLGLKAEINSLTLLAGSATLFTYMLIRLAAIKRIEEYEPDTRWDFFLNHLSLMKVITALSFVACVILFFIVERRVQFALLLPGSISIIYGLPLGKKFRLRDVGAIKIFLISFVWAYIASILPAANEGIEIFSGRVVVLFLANFCFIFAITLPFDVKDIKLDELHNVKTIPVHIGEKKTFSLSMLLLFISSGLHIYFQQYFSENVNEFTTPLIISILISALLILFTRKKVNSNFVYFGLLDGMILLQFVLCYFRVSV